MRAGGPLDPSQEGAAQKENENVTMARLAPGTRWFARPEQPERSQEAE
jgi:hypothetical protein